jgi:hypothetical protein
VDRAAGSRYTAAPDRSVSGGTGCACAETIAAILTIGVLGLTSPSLAQSVNDDVELIRSVVQTERKAVVAKNMQLTEAESEAFWPVYNEYEQAMRKVNAESEGFWPVYNEYEQAMRKVNTKRVEVLRRLAAEYQTLTDEQAEALLKASFDFQQERVKVRRSFTKKFGKVLTGKRVARFYQIDGKIDSIIDFDIARTIPLVR